MAGLVSGVEDIGFCFVVLMQYPLKINILSGLIVYYNPFQRKQYFLILFAMSPLLTLPGNEDELLGRY